MTTVSPPQPVRRTHGSLAVQAQRPLKPKDGTVWTNPTTNQDEIFNGGLWKVKLFSGGLTAANNLSDLVNAGTARSNLGLGTFAVQNIVSVPTLTFSEASNLVFGTTTGSKIGTVGGASGQKIGFWNATPIVQPVLATGAAHTVDDVITVLQNLGLVRQS